RPGARGAPALGASEGTHLETQDSALGEGYRLAAPLAIASPSASWALALSARRGQGAALGELSALQFAEGVVEGDAPQRATLGTGRLARREDEVGAGGRLGGEQGALVGDEEPAVEELAEVDATAGVRTPARAGRNLDPARAEGHGVVAGDGPPVAAAQEPIEIARGRPPDRGGIGGRVHKARGEVGEE